MENLNPPSLGTLGFDPNETGLFLERSGKIAWDLNF